MTSALPASADVLSRARDAVLAAVAEPDADAGWAEALAVLMAGLDVKAMARAYLDVRSVLELAEVGATLALLLARRELLVLSGEEFAEHEQHRADLGLTATAQVAQLDEDGTADGPPAD